VTPTETASSVKTVPPVSGIADIQGATATPDVSEYLNLCEPERTDLGTTDVVKQNNGSESEELRSDGTDVLVLGAKPAPQSQADATAAVSSSADNTSSRCTSSEFNSADKVERLRKMIDHASGQLYTIAEVYLMMMKPSRVPLEYDWVDTSTGDAATDDASAKLRKLVSIAKAAFTVSTAKHPVSLNYCYLVLSLAFV